MQHPCYLLPQLLRSCSSQVRACLTISISGLASCCPQEDWRYADQRMQLGVHFWWLSWISVFMAQSTFMFVGCLSLHPVRRIHRHMNVHPV